jgi:hypothetical protein
LFSAWEFLLEELLVTASILHRNGARVHLEVDGPPEDRRCPSFVERNPCEALDVV